MEERRKECHHTPKERYYPWFNPAFKQKKGAVDHKTGAVTKKMHVLGVYHVSVNIPIATGHAELQSTIKAQNAERRSPTLQS